MADARKNAVMFLLDRSSSMAEIKATTIESFNNYLADLKIKPDIEFSLIQFDSTSTGSGALDDQVTLKFGEAGENTEHQPAL